MISGVTRCSALSAVAIALVAHPEERRIARQPQRPGRILGRDDAAGVAVVLVKRVEVDATHGMGHVKLVLEAVGDLLRVAGDQQIVGHLGRIDRAGRAAVARQPGVLRLAGAVEELGVAGFIPVALAGLLLPELQQRVERLAERGQRAWSSKAKMTPQPAWARSFGSTPAITP